jgi:hypothetical protein
MKRRFHVAQEAVASTIIDHRKTKKLKIKHDKETSVQEILKRCEDFANETPQHEFIAQKKYSRAFIRLTPKCHPEIAGRVIEYAWGYSKHRFCHGINDAVASYLEENMKAALSREVLTINHIRSLHEKHKITSLLTPFLLHWQMARMPLQLRSH